MIRCNVTADGTVSRGAERKTDRDGRPFITFAVAVPVKNGTGTGLIDISVIANGEDPSSLFIIPETKIKVCGTLTFRKRDETLYCNLSADTVDLSPDDADGIAGVMQFRGTLGKNDIIRKQGKRGLYLLFNGYSSEKVGDDRYAYTWVHFADFSGDDYPWLCPKAGIDAEGTLELSLYDGKVNVRCRTTSLSPWEKQNHYGGR